MGGAHFQVEALEPANPQRTPQAISALVVGIALYVALGLYGSFVAQSVVEEKATRIIEILLATVRPSRSLTGKIVGTGLVGPLQLSIIAAVAFVLITLTKVVSIPTFTFTAILGYLMWFTLGFLFYAMAGSNVPAWQVGLAVGLMLVSIGGLIWLAGRIYSNSVLRLGAPVRLGDVLRGK